MDGVNYVILIAMSLCAPATAEAVLFDFENAPLHSSLPLDLTVGGITAHLSATGQGFSIQQANALGFTPAGFFMFLASGLWILAVSIVSYSRLNAPEGGVPPAAAAPGAPEVPGV